MMLSFLTKESPQSRSHRLVRPVIKKGNGIYLVKLPLQWTVQLANPEAIRTVLMRTDKFPKSLGLLKTLGDNSPFTRFFGFRNIAVTNGDEWKQQRKLMSPVFHRSMPVQLFGNVMTKVFRNIDASDGTVAVPDLMQRLTLDVIGLSAFGFDFNALDEARSEWLTTYEVVREGIRSPIPLLIPRLDKYVHYFSSGRRRIMAAVDKLNGLLLDMAERKREQLIQNAMEQKEEHEKDLLTLLLEAERRGEGEASNEFLRSNLAIFFLAGHDTTANALSFCIYHLALYKDIQRKAREEVLKVLGDEPIDVFPSIQECKRMQYIDNIIKENLRVAGPASMLGPRVADEDVMLGDTLIPKGTPISIDIYNTHHNPAVWEDPDRFLPERFEEGGEYSKNTNGLSWIPFSQGGRICIAMNFSLAEQRVSMAMLLRKYEWDIPEDSIHKNGIKLDHFQPVAPASLKINFRRRY
ncbi:cytochrome P450-dit2 [Apophysomyces ossiformis]|uniref:Cytochrome P450-dit2 n=1 Tax=Apophysomyces ossiformis TaxID=679940 RepID=A0A8H7BTS2_9FUNG|nr:cytochrome P450-dit2 [Apophysomyces ossiformis]